MEDVIADYLCSIVAMISLVELILIMNLSRTCKRLNAENDLLIKTIELQGRIVDTLAWPKKAEEQK